MPGRRVIAVGYRLYRMIRDGAPATWTSAMVHVAQVIADDATDPAFKLPEFTEWLARDYDDGPLPSSAIPLTGGWDERGRWHDGLAERTRLSEHSISRALVGLAAAGYEMRQVTGKGKGKDGRPVFATRGNPMRFQVPRLRARKAPPNVGGFEAAKGGQSRGAIARKAPPNVGGFGGKAPSNVGGYPPESPPHLATPSNKDKVKEQTGGVPPDPPVNEGHNPPPADGANAIPVTERKDPPVTRPAHPANPPATLPGMPPPAAPAPPQSEATRRAWALTDAYAATRPKGMCKRDAIRKIAQAAIESGETTDEQIRDALLRLSARNRPVTLDNLGAALRSPELGRGRESGSVTMRRLLAERQRRNGTEA